MKKHYIGVEIKTLHGTLCAHNCPHIYKKEPIGWACRAFYCMLQTIHLGEEIHSKRDPQCLSAPQWETTGYD